jgi:hypothetical protein
MLGQGRGRVETLVDYGAFVDLAGVERVVGEPIIGVVEEVPS